MALRRFLFNALGAALLLACGTLRAQNVSPRDTTALRYPFPDDNGLLYDSTRYTSPLMMEPREGISEEVMYDPLTGEYVLRRTVNGEVEYRPPVRMTLQEYADYEFNTSMRDYWRERVSNENFENQGGLIPKLYVGGKLFETIFGSNTIDIRVRGQATLEFAIQYDKTQNPALPLRMQRNTIFNFDERIQINVNGKIGENLELEIKYDTENSFDFENKTAIRYKGDEDDILQRIEAGNVSLPLAGSLIRGNQSLFGVLTEMKFGKLNLTTVISKQESETKTIEVRGGSTATEFEIKGYEYDENRHYFLSHDFRDNYERALSNLPVIQSGVTIQTIEVWVLNRQGSVDNTRNIVAFLDLAENNPDNLQNPSIVAGGRPYACNEANDLYEQLAAMEGLRSISEASSILQSLSGRGFVLGRDYEIIENARKLNANEYRYNAALGYISLNTQLKSDEVLAVAYKYSQGANASSAVGELSSDIESPKTLIVKLLKGTSFSPSYKNWALMMKNVYRLGGMQINSEDFILDIEYNDVQSGYKVFSLATPEYPAVDGVQFLRMMNLDNLNSEQQRVLEGDGVFDFVSGITIDPSRGLIYFPVLEPFGRHLQSKFGSPDNPVAMAEAAKYVYLELYDSTKTVAKQRAEKNRFLITGQYKSAGGSEISLNAMNIPRGSVQVTHGGAMLTENVDYVVDYMMGRLTIVKPGVLESGTPVQITLESNNLFSIETKTLMGAHLTYDLGDKLNVGATILNLRESAMQTQKVSIGNELLNNTIWGMNASYRNEAPGLTKLVDKLPFLDTKARSSVSLEGEFAHFIPGHNKRVNRAGISYIDDFEGATSDIDLRLPYEWRLASTPSMFPEAQAVINDLAFRSKVGHISWYIIESSFYENGSPVSKNATSSLNTCQFLETQLFPNVDNEQSLYSNISILNLAYYPRERGAYNYAFDRLDSQGDLIEPEGNWGGVMRALPSTDFEALNVEYVEFWLMDPYAEDEADGVVRQARSPRLYINLGDVSEDVLKDGKKSFEQGLPKNGELANVDSTPWGRVSTLQEYVKQFDTDAASRVFQDVGLDGLSNADERLFFSPLLATIGSDVVTEARERIMADPSHDNFRYFRDGEVEEDPRTADNILERYRYYSGTDNNSPANSTTSGATQMAYSTPDGEDINGDFTLSQAENYFQYQVDLSKENFESYKNFIVDETEVTLKMPNNEMKTVRWYQFKIPVKNPDDKVGQIEDFRSIRFMRMFLTGFDQPVVLRFARLNLVRSDWRRYEYVLEENYETLNPNINLDQTSFEVLTVNIEENANRTPVNYVLPPNVDREITMSGTTTNQLNEQALSLRVEDLPDGFAKAVYKNVGMDMRLYGTLGMDVHAESLLDHTPIEDGDMSVFVRLGSDFLENYYEYEIPLKVTPAGNYPDNTWGRLEVWPESNRLEVALQTLLEVKNQRNIDMAEAGSSVTLQTEYVKPDGRNMVKVMGNPSLAEVEAIMIGIRNPRDDGREVSAEVWVNELGLSDFVDKGGWAATARASAQLADLGSVTVSGSKSTAGFGSLEQGMSERSLDNTTQYDMSTNLDFGRFFPRDANVRIPMYLSYGEASITPEYNPFDEDMLLSVALSNPNLSREEREQLRNNSRDYTRRKSLNFTGVKIGKTKSKPRFYNISNWTAGYSFTETYMENPNTQYNSQVRHVATLSYVFQQKPKAFEPFKSMKIFRPKWLALIRDINLYYAPNQLSFQTQVDRRYNEMLRRNLNNPNQIFTPSYDKSFNWTRAYLVNYNLAQGIKIDFSSNVAARVEEPEGRIDREMDQYEITREQITRSLQELGRTTDYNHDIKITYSIPINKLPGLDWISATASYVGRYIWDISPNYLVDSMNFGNSIQNSNQRILNGTFNTNRLFTKVKYVSDIHKKFKLPLDKRFNEKKMVEVKYEKGNVRIRKNAKKSFTHRLETVDVQVELTDSEGKKLDYAVTVDNWNRVTIEARENIENAQLVVTGSREKQESAFSIAAAYLTRVATGLSNVTFGYSSTLGSMLSGYNQEADFFGASPGFSAPGLGYMFGLTSEDFIKKVFENDWMSTNVTEAVVSPYQMTFARQVNLKVVYEPLADFKVDINWSHNSTSNSSTQYFAVNGIYMLDENGDVVGYNYQSTGNFSHSFLPIRTSFQRVDKRLFQSPAYKQFLAIRPEVAWQLARERQKAVKDYDPGNGLYPLGYNQTSPDVLYYAFQSAFSGKNPDSYRKGPGEIIPSILAAAPNWRVDYKGLTKIKFIGRYFRSVNIQHTYNSNFTVAGYQSNPDFLNGVGGYSPSMNIEGTYYIPEYLMNTVSMQETFGPLAGLTLTWKNGITTGFNLKRDRNVSLSLTNATVTEIRSQDYTFRTGYAIKDVPLVFKTKGGGQRKFVSNVNVTADFSIRNNITYTHQISTEISEAVTGKKYYALKLGADYQFTKDLNLRAFYEHTIDTPQGKATSFRTVRAKFGFSVNYRLSDR